MSHDVVCGACVDARGGGVVRAGSRGRGSLGTPENAQLTCLQQCACQHSDGIFPPMISIDARITSMKDVTCNRNAGLLAEYVFKAAKLYLPAICLQQHMQCTAAVQCLSISALQGLSTPGSQHMDRPIQASLALPAPCPCWPAPQIHAPGSSAILSIPQCPAPPVPPPPQQTPLAGPGSARVLHTTLSGCRTRTKNSLAATGSSQVALLVIRQFDGHLRRACQSAPLTGTPITN